MTSEERRAALDAIVEAEMRCHGWPAEAADGALRSEVMAWWKADPDAAEAYLAAQAAVARADLAWLTRPLPRGREAR